MFVEITTSGSISFTDTFVGILERNANVFGITRQKCRAPFGYESSYGNEIGSSINTASGRVASRVSTTLPSRNQADETLVPIANDDRTELPFE
jgi:hypothetical protein